MFSDSEKESRGSGADTSLGSPPVRKSKVQGFEEYFAAEVSTAHADILLLACCLISGFVDSTLYLAFYTFVSMQTGNTIFVGLGASDQNARPFGWARSLLSIVCFMIGSLLFSRFSYFFGPLKRRTLFLSFFIQSILILVAASLIEGDVVDGRLPIQGIAVHWNQLAPISLLSIQAAGQIVGSRALGYGEIPTVVITSLLCDLYSDKALLAPLNKNAKRNRRVSAFCLTMIGAISGGWVAKGTGGVQNSLWVAGAIKMAITLAWLFWSEKTLPVPAAGSTV